MSASLRSEVSKFLIDQIFLNITIFSSLPSDLLSGIFTALKPEQYSKGDTIHNCGDAGRDMYIVNSGRIVMTNKNPDNLIEFATYEAGSCFGVIYALNMARCNARNSQCLLFLNNICPRLIANGFQEATLKTKSSLFCPALVCRLRFGTCALSQTRPRRSASLYIYI